MSRLCPKWNVWLFASLKFDPFQYLRNKQGLSKLFFNKFHKVHKSLKGQKMSSWMQIFSNIYGNFQSWPKNLHVPIKCLGRLLLTVLYGAGNYLQMQKSHLPNFYQNHNSKAINFWRMSLRPIWRICDFINVEIVSAYNLSNFSHNCEPDTCQRKCIKHDCFLNKLSRFLQKS